MKLGDRELSRADLAFLAFLAALMAVVLWSGILIHGV